ncbi:hypothetical protein ACROYT_G013848 [Oculina patagonica]
MTLAPVGKACFIPVSVQYIDLRLLVANSHPAKPEVLVCHAFTGAVLQVITSPLLRCPSGIAMPKTGTKLFITDSVSHVVLEVQQWGKPNYTVDAWVGQDKNSGTVDGTGPSAKLNCPHGITLFGNTVVLCDSGNGAIRVVTSGDPLRKICSVLYEYENLFRLDHKRVNDGNPPRSFEEGMKVVDRVVDFLFKWEVENRKITGRRSTQGPDQIIPYATRRSFALMHKSLWRLVNLFEEIHMIPCQHSWLTKGDVVAVRHARKREEWEFLLALLNKDLVVKQRSSVDIVFLDGAMDITWLANSSSDDIFVFREGNRDTHNSPYTVIDKVDVGIGEDDQGRFYIICQADVDRLERQLKGGPDSDVASESSDDEENDEPESFEPRVSVTTRSGRLTSRLRLC